jgi:hypothetical protein
LAKAIDLRLHSSLVRLSIDLNQQTGGKACKIGNVAADGVLATKLEAAGPHTKRSPQQSLRQAHLPP